MKKTLIFLTLLGFIITLKTVSHAQTEQYYVLELFTSQSCSSCPPADKILETLSENNQIIALSCNVTYWNHLFWKDTLSKDFCTKRQRSYSAVMGRNGNIFTPELIINGKHSLIGSQKETIYNTLKTTNPLPAIAIEQTEDHLILQKPNFAIHPKDIILLITYQNVHKQSIRSGENRGRSVSYTNPIISIKRIENSWKNGILTIDKTTHITKQAAASVILIHDGNNKERPLIAAGKIIYK